MTAAEQVGALNFPGFPPIRAVGPAITAVESCYACGRRGQLIPDRGRRYCERCLFADMDREIAEADTPVSVKAR